jgi:hypothetical protein
MWGSSCYVHRSGGPCQISKLLHFNLHRVAQVSLQVVMEGRLGGFELRLHVRPSSRQSPGMEDTISQIALACRTAMYLGSSSKKHILS